MNRNKKINENILALMLCFLIIALLIMTADDAPLWLYQGF